MFNRPFLLAAAILFSAPNLTVAQNLITNGGFDAGTQGWTIINIPGFGGYHSSVGNPGGTLHLDNTAPSLTSDPTASQLVTGFVAGAVYSVSGDYRQAKIRGTGLPDGPSLGVAIDGVELFSATAPGNFNTWYDFNFDYLATASSATLSLSAQINGTGATYYFDNISMTAVPEPDFVVVMAGCLLFATLHNRSSRE